MKITSVTEVKFFVVNAIDEQDDNKPKMFRRPVNGNLNDWEESMGESWEQTYGDSQLEQLFQQYQKQRKLK